MKRRIVQIALALALAAGNLSTARAYTLGGATRAAPAGIEALFIKARERAVAPFAHVIFCHQMPTECVANDGSDMVELTTETLDQLHSVNRQVNRQIRPRYDTGLDKWSLAPATGDCEDYAITKRHALISRGWPASALRLAVTHTSWGEAHMVLVVKTSEGDLVLDNMFGEIKNWREANLRWEMIQSSNNPKNWYRL